MINELDYFTYIDNKIDKTKEKINKLEHTKKILLELKSNLADCGLNFIEPHKKKYIQDVCLLIPSRIRSAYKKRQLLELNREGLLDDYIKSNPI